MDFEKWKEIERKLRHQIPYDLFRDPVDKTSSVIKNVDENKFHKDYSAESSMIYDPQPQSPCLLALATTQSSLPYRNLWVFDSGSGRHICRDKNLFWKLKLVKSAKIITIGAGEFKDDGVRSVKLEANPPKGLGKLKVEDVLYVLGFMVNLVSMDRLKDQILIWDHSNNWLTNWVAMRTPVLKIWN